MIRPTLVPYDVLHDTWRRAGFSTPAQQFKHQWLEAFIQLSMFIFAYRAYGVGIEQVLGVLTTSIVLGLIAATALMYFGKWICIIHDRKIATGFYFKR